MSEEREVQPITRSCSEERPKCRLCVRRNVSCEYPDQLPRASTNSPSASKAHLADSPALSYSPSQQSEPTPNTAPLLCLYPSSTETLKLSNLRLLHHWTVSTSLAMSQYPKDCYIWQTVLPQIGFQYSFVLHAVLSLAALHIAYHDTPETKSMWMEGIDYHSKSVLGFQKEVAHITDESSEALFMWSLCNLIYTFATSNPLRQGPDATNSSGSSTQYDKLLGAEWIPMMRGVTAILEPTHNSLRFGRMNTMMSLGNWDELDPDKGDQDPEDIQFCGTRETWKSSEKAHVYEDVLQTLRRCRLYSAQFRQMDAETLENWGYNKEFSAPLTWINLAPEAYFSLLQQRQPPALILFSFFGAMLHRLNHYWFMEGWGKATVEAIADILGSYWRPWISWPLRVIHDSE
ncbi:Sterol uptake control 2 [Fusarium acutatum]|uniref:Sterol uptake control 2 n=1 Tax=Fusarium acutatum TaxID=78861 RepID=A0A8H4NJU3_9HYPO|nr:Sterol uptake control 2 [Fusarium acutatum]